MKLLRKLVLWLWLVLLAGALVWYISDPASFTAENIAGYLKKFQGGLVVSYLLMHVLRAFTLLPSTPLVIAGVLIFPDDPGLVLLMSISGIVLSSTLIYYFSDFLGFDEYLDSHHPRKMESIHRRLNHPLAILFVAAWAFFPAVPTDLVCYAAGSVRMPFRKFILGVFVGELALCSLYIYAGSDFWHYLF
ncbi:MAG: TVP38/TMEM64 family protein [Flavobacteriales bacterium]|nr:TVP38/TMEM64 family protein [Flavobacteriales bacterium]